MDQTYLLWALLTSGDLDDVKKLDPERIDWSSTHKTYGITLLMQCVNLILNKASILEKVLDCTKWFVECGANPSQECSSKWHFSVWKNRDEEGTKIDISYSGHSAVSYVEAWSAKLKSSKDDWSHKISLLPRVLTCFVTAIPKEKATRVSIHEGVAELWEQFLAAKASHDLTFKTADGEVTAHVHMLKIASSVIGAMLASPMKEGQARSIEVPDTNSSSVSLFLERLVFTYFFVGVILLKI